jgi:hypothetical protein
MLVGWGVWDINCCLAHLLTIRRFTVKLVMNVSRGTLLQYSYHWYWTCYHDLLNWPTSIKKWDWSNLIKMSISICILTLPAGELYYFFWGLGGNNPFILGETYSSLLMVKQKSYFRISDKYFSRCTFLLVGHGGSISRALSNCSQTAFVSSNRRISRRPKCGYRTCTTNIRSTGSKDLRVIWRPLSCEYVHVPVSLAFVVL